MAFVDISKKRKRDPQNGSMNCGLTQPQEFRFSTDERSRMRDKLRQSEMPFIETLNTSIPSKNDVLSITKLEPFSFSTTSQKRSTNYEDRTLVGEVNKKIYESSGDLGVPRISKRPLTQPKSPNFATSTRVRIQRSQILKPVEETTIDKPLRKKKKSLTLTVPQPFNFASTNRKKSSYMLVNPERVKEQRTMIHDIFYRTKPHRHPTPESNQPKPLTEVQEFSFQTDLRSKKRQQVLKVKALRDLHAKSENENVSNTKRIKSMPKQLYKPALTNPKTPNLSYKRSKNKWVS